MIAIFVVIIVGISITVLLGYMAYKHFKSTRRIRRQQPPPANAVAQPAPAGAVVTRTQASTRNLRWLWWSLTALVVALLVLAGITTVMYLFRSTNTTTNATTISVGREWSEQIRVFPGNNVAWDRRRNADYEIITQTGKIYRYPRDPENDTRTACERYVRIPGALSSFRIRVTDPKVERVEFDITFSPYSPDGPCGPTVPPTTAPAPPPPSPLERPRMIPVKGATSDVAPFLYLR